MNQADPGAKKKILVIDDEGDLLRVERLRLEASGYEVTTLSGGERALQVAKAEKPDLILLDIVMPGKNGCEVCRELKADEATRGIPVIIFTAHYPEEEYIKMGLEDVGADDYMIKPFSPQLLLVKIKALIK
jgi:DNA-binding response OmpR family regulator